ncbi:hypothetical protein FIM02_01635, partial [SAR202 cluster bacterium AD-802-E10_MRT_200m]|nr:hypothetical protein [SAR202 cluster bacterium AD-802-E10_MRT_200m]
MKFQAIQLLLLTSALMLSVGCGGSTGQSVPTITTLEPSIKLINHSSYQTENIEKWIALAESKMESRESRIFAFVYPVGKLNEPKKRIRSDYADRVFQEHEVLLSQDEIEVTLGEIELWLQEDSCLSSRDKKQALSDYRTWLEKGADASTMHGLCQRTRIVMMAIPATMRDHEPLENFQNFLIHEFYHAFQQDLVMERECLRKQEASDNRNSVWMYEGGAHYFATWLVAEIHGTLNYRSQILRDAKEAFERSGHRPSSLYTAEPDRTGAAALSLMIEHDMITEESILDGSL